jgi:cell division protein FtsQ
LGIRRKRQNRFKRRRPKKNRHLVSSGLKLASGGIGVALLSIIFIFCHDVVTQCDAFKTKTVAVTGNRRLNREEIYQRAGIFPGSNILAVNSVAARKRLLADPWIADAQIRREIPDGIHVVIREHHALAVIDLGRKFLLDDAGTIFKEVAPRDADNLPVVEGLRYADIERQPSAAGAGLPTPQTNRPSNGDLNPASPFAAVVAVLRLGARADSIIPNRHLSRVVVDSETGITLQTRKGPKTVKLGFQNYARKYAMLRRLLAYLEQHRPGGWRELETVDLNNLDRIVVEPVYNSEKTSETGHKGRKISNNAPVAHAPAPAPVYGAHPIMTSHFGRRYIPSSCLSNNWNIEIFKLFRALPARRPNAQNCELILS